MAKTQGIWKFGQNTGKTQGILFAQVVSSLMPKIKDIAIFAAKIYIFFQKLDSQICVCIIVTNYGNWHRENLRLDRENTGI